MNDEGVPGRRFGHDEAVSELRRLAATVDERDAADAFVASLGSAERRWRALLPAVALGTAMPAHDFPAGAGVRICGVCFLERTTVIEPAAAESVLPGEVCEYILALEAAAEPLPSPEPADIWVLHEIFDALRGLPPTTRPGAAARALRSRGLLPGRPVHEYTSLLEDLAFLGILETPEHPGMYTAFTTARQRDERPSVRVEVSAPLSFWNAGHGVTDSLVRRLFGHLDRPSVPPVRPPAPPPVPRKTGGRAAPLPPVLRGEPRAGDIYAVQCREDAWVLAYCHRTDELNGRSYGLVEYLDGFFGTVPTAAEVGGRGLRGRRDGRWQQWTTQLAKTPRVRRVARDIPAPADDRPPPDRVPFGSAKDLRHLAGWCFPELES